MDGMRGTCFSQQSNFFTNFKFIINIKFFRYVCPFQHVHSEVDISEWDTTYEKQMLYFGAITTSRSSNGVCTNLEKNIRSTFIFSISSIHFSVGSHVLVYFRISKGDCCEWHGKKMCYLRQYNTIFTADKIMRYNLYFIFFFVILNMYNNMKISIPTFCQRLGV